MLEHKSNKYTNSRVGLFGKFNYDFAPSLSLADKNIFLYGGATLGTYFSSGSRIILLGQLGMGYMLTEQIGVNAEVRFGIVNNSGSEFGIGLVYKLKQE